MAHAPLAHHYAASSAYQAAQAAARPGPQPEAAARLAVEAAVQVSVTDSEREAARLSELAAQGELLLDFAGIGWEFDPSWRTITAVALALGIYEDRAFDRMPILADALQDADCGSEWLLQRMRTQTVWYRGTKIIDDLLGKRG